MLIVFVFIILILLIVSGVPVAVSLGLTAVMTFIALGDVHILPILAQRMFASTTSFTLLAVPFFILAGNLMNNGGITRRIFRFAKALVGWVPGGLGQVNVIGNMIFSGMSGSAIADAVGLGQINMKAMIDNGYDKKFAAAITSAASTIGPVIPPSIPFVLFASLTTVSVIKLFLAGFIPGFMMGLTLMIVVGIISVVRRYPRDKITNLKTFFGELLNSFIGAFFPMLTPIIIIGGILSGIFTPTEASVVACVYALVLGFMYQEIKIKELPRIFWESVCHTASLMLIIAAAEFFSYLLIHQKIADDLIMGLTSLGTSKAVVIGIFMFVVLLMGFFIEGNAIFFITVPVFMKIAVQFNIDLVHLGVIMTLGIMIGNLTPPVGMCVFAVSRITGLSVGAIAREAWPYIVGIGVVWIIIAFVPEISTFLPNLIEGTGN